MAMVPMSSGEPAAAWPAVREECPDWPDCHTQEIPVSNPRVSLVLDQITGLGLDPLDAEIEWSPDLGTIITFSCSGSEVCAHALNLCGYHNAGR